MDASFYPVNVSASVSSKPKELVFDIKGLVVSAVTRMSYGVDAMGKDFRIVVVDSSGRRNGVIAGHKRISITDNLMIGWLSSIRIDPPVPIN